VKVVHLGKHYGYRRRNDSVPGDLKSEGWNATIMTNAMRRTAIGS